MKVSLGTKHSSFLNQHGDLYLFGSNSHGQLGLNVSQTSIPTLIPWEVKIIDVSCGEDYTLFVTTDHLVYGMGKNDNGQLGIGSVADNVPFPVKLSQLGDLVFAATHHSFILYRNQLYSFGKKWYTGFLDNIDRLIPSLVTQDQVKLVFPSVIHSLVLY
jgi:alpha-tubulin suppressor-like RCC1 family protein